jgi:hypothetical protein
VLDNAQSLMVNQMMAAICGQYLYDLVIHRRLTRFRTVVDLESLKHAQRCDHQPGAGRGLRPDGRCNQRRKSNQETEGCMTTEHMVIATSEAAIARFAYDALDSETRIVVQQKTIARFASASRPCSAARSRSGSGCARSRRA